MMTKPDWQKVKDYEDITYHKSNGVARIAFNRPEVRNAFRPKTVLELLQAFDLAHEDPRVGVIIPITTPILSSTNCTCVDSRGIRRQVSQPTTVGHSWASSEKSLI